MSDKLTSQQLRDLRNMLTTALADGGGLDQLVEVLDTKIAYREAERPDTPPATWPPKWGEGPTHGWCRRKGFTDVFLWSHSRPGSIFVSSEDGDAHFYSTEFAAEFEPA